MIIIFLKVNILIKTKERCLIVISEFNQGISLYRLIKTENLSSNTGKKQSESITLVRECRYFFIKRQFFFIL